jgi:hypothetical protein
LAEIPCPAEEKGSELTLYFPSGTKFPSKSSAKLLKALRYAAQSPRMLR